MKPLNQHQAEVKKIAQQISLYAKSGRKKKLRFYHGGTNSTRQQNMKDFYLIDISHLGGVLEVNPKEKYILVEPNIPMDRLVDTTLQYGLIPAVVMEFPGITVGGAINGGTLESSSYKYGQLSDIALEYQIILGNGKIIQVSPKKHPDIFFGISSTYGTIGLITLVKLKLISSAKYVHTRFYPTTNSAKNLALLKEQMLVKSNNYVEGILYDKTHSVVIVGSLTNIISKGLTIKTYSKAIDIWFYEQGKKVLKNKNVYEELIPIKDYLFRYNRGAFWIGDNSFPKYIPNNRITKFLLNPFFNTRKMYDVLHAINGSQSFFIQDFYCPIENTLKLIEYSHKRLGIYPVWLCPIKSVKSPQKLSPHYINSSMLIDIGIWGKYKKVLVDAIAINREFESFAKKLHAKKMLYAHTYYTEAEFWSIYDKHWYDILRKKYHAEKIFPDVWQKVRVTGRYKKHLWTGFFKVLLDTIRGKHLAA